MFRKMRTNPRTPALVVVAAGTIAALSVGLVAGSQAFGVTHGRRFASAPSQARFGHLPNTLSNRSISQCPAAGQTVNVALTQGTTTLASASTIADAKGKWAVTMSIPSNLKPGTYAVTASCSAGGPSTLSYNPQNFRVVPAVCPPGPTTTTTVKCRVPPTTTTT
jgi:hypothetical protein